MGCTGRGIPKTTPVIRLNIPEKTKVVDSDIEPLTARVIMSGNKVPRSPNAPDISESGDRRSVEALLRLNCRSLERNVMFTSRERR